MKRKYPAKMFLLFVLTNFLFRFFYLFIPGTVLCVVGIWSQTYLYVGLAVLGLDLILSIVEQVRIRNAAVGQSENPDFNEMMDAFAAKADCVLPEKCLTKSSDSTMLTNLKTRKTDLRECRDRSLLIRESFGGIQWINRR